ncbi:MAG: hypothetical protein PHW32_03215 [Bacilli bacterium]|nr:hypothetical protein [Bacilli bacterium]MDD4282870.1 hypothetical protein [Bacilli bacterium]MDD4718302.1 hypothetical protein [Bacilli bacterium]
MKKSSEIILGVIILSWLVPFLINKFSRNKNLIFIPIIIPVLGSIFSLFGIFQATKDFNELVHLFGLSLSLISLTTMAITIIILKIKNTKIN